MSQAQSVLIGLVMANGGLLIVILFALRRLRRRVKALAPSSVLKRIEEFDARQKSIEELLRRILEIPSGEKDQNPDSLGSSPSQPRKGRADGSSIRMDRPHSFEPMTSPTLIAIPNLSAGEPQPTNDAAEELSDRFGGIWILADSGHTADEIARATELPIGQVELILALRRRVISQGGVRD